MFVYGVGFGVWLGVECSCPTINNNIVTLRYLFSHHCTLGARGQSQHLRTISTIMKPNSHDFWLRKRSISMSEDEHNNWLKKRMNMTLDWKIGQTQPLRKRTKTTIEWERGQSPNGSSSKTIHGNKNSPFNQCKLCKNKLPYFSFVETWIVHKHSTWWERGQTTLDWERG